MTPEKHRLMNTALIACTTLMVLVVFLFVINASQKVETLESCSDRLYEHLTEEKILHGG